MPSIAGCPGLVSGWRAFPAINRVRLPTPPPYVFSVMANALAQCLKKGVKP